MREFPIPDTMAACRCPTNSWNVRRQNRRAGRKNKKEKSICTKGHGGVAAAVKKDPATQKARDPIEQGFPPELGGNDIR